MLSTSGYAEAVMPLRSSSRSEDGGYLLMGWRAEVAMLSDTPSTASSENVCFDFFANHVRSHVNLCTPRRTGLRCDCAGCSGSPDYKVKRFCSNDSHVDILHEYTVKGQVSWLKGTIVDKFTRPFMTNGLTHLHFVSFSFLAMKSKQAERELRRHAMDVCKCVAWHGWARYQESSTLNAHAACWINASSPPARHQVLDVDGMIVGELNLRLSYSNGKHKHMITASPTSCNNSSKRCNFGAFFRVISLFIRLRRVGFLKDDMVTAAAGLFIYLHLRPSPGEC